MPKVFISYSHDSPEHSARVLGLANALRGHGSMADILLYRAGCSASLMRWRRPPGSSRRPVTTAAPNSYATPGRPLSAGPNNPTIP